MTRVTIICQLYSGLEIVLKSQSWTHTGSPAFYNFIKIINQNDKFSSDIFLLATKKIKGPKKIKLKGIKNKVHICSGPGISKSKNTFLNKLSFFRGKLIQAFIIFKNLSPTDVFYIDRDNILIGFFVLLFTKKKVVFRMLGITQSFYLHLVQKKKLFSFLLKWVFQHKNSYFICTNDGSYSSKIASIYGPKKFMLMFNGVNFMKKSDYESKKKQYKIIYPARFEQSKGHIDIINFFKYYKNRNSFKVTFIGGGSLLNFSKKLVTDFELESNIEFIEATEHQTIMTLLKNSDLFLSVNSDGSIGNNVLEASSLGIPIITLFHPGCDKSDLKNFRIISSLSNLRNELTFELNNFLRSQSYRYQMSKDSFCFAKENIQNWDDRIHKELHFLTGLNKKQ